MVLSRQMSWRKDLVVEPSLRVSLNGLKRTKDAREFFILVRPLVVKVKAYDPVVVGLLGFR